jgi:dolichol-phosphate mannosyltransferase
LKKLVIIPTYKERENAQQILKAIYDLEQNFHVLIIDDNSPDGTADIVKTIQQENQDRLFLIERPGKLGLGTAYITGFRLFLACSKGTADVAVGSRYVNGGEFENWPLSRKIISMGGALYSRLITWIPVHDPTAGFVCYKKEVLAAMNLLEIKSIGYAFQIEMKFAAWKLGFKIAEVPIVFKDRAFGSSKMTKGIIKEGIRGVLALQKEFLLGRYVKRLKNK